MANPYREQAADAALAQAESIAAHVDIADAIEAAGASVAALVAAAEAAVGQACRESTRRTEALPPTRRDECGVVPVHRTMGRGTEADEYEVCESPMGRPDSLGAARALAADERDITAWAIRNVLADTGQLLTRNQRRNRRRSLRRGKVAP